jgi:hypothetical protein
LPHPPNSDLFDADDDDLPDGWLPPDFFADDIDEDDMEQLGEIQRLTGRSFEQLIEPFDDIVKTGRAGTVRGTRFASGSEALLWLFRTGIFLYSSIVRFSDGTYGVAIGDSGRPLQGSNEQNDIPF